MMKFLINVISIIVLLQCCNNKNTNQTQSDPNVKPLSENLVKSIRISVDNNEQREINKNCIESLINAVQLIDSVRIRKILSDGCDVNQKLTTGHNYYAKDSTYKTALSHSANYDITKLLLESGANPNIELGIRSPLEFAVLQNRNDIARLLIANGADVNHFNKFTEYQSPLIAAISTGNIEALKLLIANKAKFKPYAKNIHEPLHKAIRHKRLEVAKFLIQNGVSTRTKITPKNLEGEFGDCVPCPYEIEPIHSAAQISDSQIAIKFIDLLVTNGANVNAVNKHKQTALSYIANKGSSEIAKYLIEKGADVDSKSVSTAAAYQNNEFLQVLLNNGGNPNENTKDNFTPLNQAIFCCGDGFNDETVQNRIETVNILLEYGAKVDDSLLNKIRKQERLKPILSILEKHIE